MDAQKLELEMVVSCYVDSVNENWILCQSSKCSKSLSHLSNLNVLILYSATLLNASICCRSILVESFGAFTCRIITCKYGYSYCFSYLHFFISFITYKVHIIHLYIHIYFIKCLNMRVVYLKIFLMEIFCHIALFRHFFPSVLVYYTF